MHASQARAAGCLGRTKDIPILVFADDKASCDAAKKILNDAAFTRVVNAGEWTDGKIEDMDQLRTSIVEGNDAMKIYQEKLAGFEEVSIFPAGRNKA